MRMTTLASFAVDFRGFCEMYVAEQGELEDFGLSVSMEVISIWSNWFFCGNALIVIKINGVERITYVPPLLTSGFNHDQQAIEC